MKKEQREIYQILANEIDFILCSFCKFAKSSGYCCDGDLECTHPLKDHVTFEYEMDSAAEMGDCWGFRPTHDVSFMADLVGFALENKWGYMTWWQDEQGIWRVAGQVDFQG